MVNKFMWYFLVLPPPPLPPQHNMEDLGNTFIEIVRGRPVLYDLTHPNYKDTDTVKRNNWLEVISEWKDVSGEELTFEKIVKKWVNLRDTYTSQKRKYEHALASGLSPTAEPKWRLWHSMKWYNEFTKKKSSSASTTSNGLVALPYTNNSEESFDGGLHFDFDSYPKLEPNDSYAKSPVSTPAIPDNSAAPSSINHVALRSPPKIYPNYKKISPRVDMRRKRTCPSFNTVNKPINGIQKQLNSSTPTTDDEALSYAKSLAHKLRRLSPYKLALARKRMEEVLFEVEFGETEPQAQAKCNHPLSLESLNNIEMIPDG